MAQVTTRHPVRSEYLGWEIRIVTHAVSLLLAQAPLHD